MDVLVLILYFGLPLAVTFSIVWFLKGLTRNLALCLVFGLIGALFVYCFAEYMQFSHGPYENGMDASFDKESALAIAIFSIAMGISAAIGALASFIMRYFARKHPKATL